MDMVGFYASYRGLEEKGLARSLDVLKRSGVNTLILGGGYRVSAEVESLYPFKPRPRPEPEGLPTVLKECRAREMKLWLVIGVSYAESIRSPEDFPELAVEDVEGRVIVPDHSLGFAWSSSCCPSKPAINAYHEALFEELGRRYEFDGVTLTHHRFSPPSSNLMNLFSCFCPDCVKTAGELGYDAEASRKACLSLLRELRRLTPSAANWLSDADSSDFSSFEALGLPQAASDWFRFRCELIERSLKRFIDAAKSHGQSFLFGTDNYPVSFAWVVGHRYRELERIGDFLMPLLNHPTIFITLVFAEICKTLMAWNPSHKEEATLRALYKVFGYGDMQLPGGILELLGRHVVGDTYETVVPLHELIYREASRTRTLSSGSKPFITVLEGHSNLKPEALKQRIAAVRRAGADGIAFTSFESATDETLAAIRDGLET